LFVGSLLLFLSELRSFAFLLFLDPLLHGIPVKLLSLLILIVPQYFVIQLPFLLFFLLLQSLGHIISSCNFYQHLLGFLLPLSNSFIFCFFCLLDLSGHHLELPLLHLAILDSLLISFSYLINQNCLASLSGFNSSLFSYLIFFNLLKPFNFHHHIELLLLTEILPFEVFILFNLSISNSGHFREEKFRVHSFNVIFLFIKHSLGPR
jgi:hypothetical protein